VLSGLPLGAHIALVRSVGWRPVRLRVKSGRGGHGLDRGNPDHGVGATCSPGGN
jgi:hypothetical protein